MGGTLRNAIAAAGGMPISDEWVHPLDLIEIGLLETADPETAWPSYASDVASRYAADQGDAGGVMVRASSLYCHDRRRRICAAHRGGTAGRVR